MAEHHDNGPGRRPPRETSLALVEMDTDRLVRLVPRLDRDVREARRVLPPCAEIDDAAYLAARCRIELRRRQAADRLVAAQRLLARVGGDQA